MNLLYDHSIFQQKYGGISRYFYEIISRLLFFDDVDIEMFMGLFVNQYGLEKFKDTFDHYWGYPVPAIPRTGRARQFLNRLLWKKFQFHLSSTDDRIYHPTYYNYYGTAKAKTVFTVYDFTHERYPHFFPGDGTPDLKRKAFERADALICISESTKKDLLNLYSVRDSCEIKVVHLGYSDFEKQSVAGSITLPLRPYFLFVGPRHAYKNFTCLVEAFALSTVLKKESMLVCFGGAPFTSSEMAFFDQLGISDKVVRYPGDDGALGTLYKNAIALVYPSFYEGFGIPILEAMSCGCPVIASNNSSIPEVAGDAALFFDPASKESLINAMSRIASDTNLRDVMKASGVLRCRTFSWDRCAKETFAFYKELGRI